VGRKPKKKNAKVALIMRYQNKKERNKDIINKEAQNKLKTPQKNRISILSPHNIKSEKKQENR